MKILETFFLTFSDSAKYADLAKSIVLDNGYLPLFNFWGGNNAINIQPFTPYSISVFFKIFGVNDFAVMIQSFAAESKKLDAYETALYIVFYRPDTPGANIFKALVCNNKDGPGLLLCEFFRFFSFFDFDQSTIRVSNVGVSSKQQKYEHFTWKINSS